MPAQCIICQKPTERTKKGPYRKTCSEECLSVYKSKKASKSIKEMRKGSSAWSTRFNIKRSSHD